MQVKDIQYDGELFSEHNLLVCYLDSKADTDININNILSLIQTKAVHASKWYTVGADYEEVLQFEFDVARLNCDNLNDYELSDVEINDIMYWLNRKEMHHMEIIMDDGSFDKCYFNGTFTSITPLMISNAVVGFHLVFMTDAPYSHLPDVTIEYEYEDSDEDDGNDQDVQISFTDASNEEGYQYCDVTIKCLEDGDLVFRNTRDEKAVIVNNCKTDEVITINGSIKYIETNDSTHKTFSSDFNYHFPRILNKRGNKENTFTCSLKSNITLTYSPIRKVGGFIC